MSATLGGLIKDLRIQKNLSQLEIAFALGWKESSRLSRIEQGRVERPNRKLLDNLMIAMKLNTDERNRLYIAGSYLPTKADIAIARKKLAPLINPWSYPASVLDFSWRVILTNQKLYDLHGLSKTDQQYIEEKMPNLLEIIFSPNFTADHRDKEFDIRMLVHFQFAQQSQTKERWYLDLVQRMMKNKYFRELWSLTQKYNTTDYDVFNFCKKSVKGLSFYDVVMPVFNDPRFMVDYYLPANISTHQYYQLSK